VSIKAYSCIGTSQAMVAGVIQARQNIADPVKEIKHLEVRMADTPFVRGQVEDEDRRYPTSRETADHSFFYLAAVALMDGEMTQAQFESAGCSAVKSLMERMTIAPAPFEQVHSAASCVQLTTVNGENRTVKFLSQGHRKIACHRVEEIQAARRCYQHSKPDYLAGS
jgi:2-methylcitrate dehydratase PrpD